MDEMSKTIAAHLNPIWRDLADFIIMARIEDDVLEGRLEQLWARQLDESHFEICCIPFFVRDIDLGDHVETALEDDGTYIVRKVVRKLGHYTFRAWFGNTNHPAAREEAVNEMLELGCLCEWYSRNLLGIDAASEEQAQETADYLAKKENLGHLTYETGHTERGSY